MLTLTMTVDQLPKAARAVAGIGTLRLHRRQVGRATSSLLVRRRTDPDRFDDGVKV
jgi:hypothetical protein